MGPAGNHDALPPFSVRVSPRARHVRLTVTPRDGLTVVVPRGWRGDASAIVAARIDWIERALAKVADKRELHAGGARTLLPDEVYFRATGQRWSVRYVETSSAHPRVTHRYSRLTVSVPGGDPEAALRALDAWLSRAARAALPPMLDGLSTTHGIPYVRCAVRKVSSRWGSASVRGTISLARTLVFLPPHLVRAVMLHELAHLRILDHSPRFWAYLGTLDPQVARHRAELRRAQDLVPAWAEA